MKACDTGMNTKMTENLPNKAPTVATNTEDGTSSTTKTTQKVPSTVSIQGEQINPLEPRKLPNMGKGPTNLEPPTPAKRNHSKRQIDSTGIESSEDPKKKKAGKAKIDVDTVTFDEINVLGKSYNVFVCVTIVCNGKLYGARNPNSITFLATDKQGKNFEVLIDDGLYDKWTKRITEGQIYLLKKVTCIDAKKMLKLTNRDVQLLIDKHTISILIQINIINIEPVLPLTKFNALPVETNEVRYLFNIVGYVINVCPRSVRNLIDRQPAEFVEIYLIDDTSLTTAIALTIWNQLYEKNTHIFKESCTEPFTLTVVGLKLKLYNGRPYFQITCFTKFKVGDIIKKSEIAIQRWANTNISLRTLKIEDLSEPQRLIPTSRAQHSNAIQFFNSIYEMIQHTPRELQPGKDMLFAVNARIINVYLNGQIAYDSCAKCSKSVTSYDASKFSCPACQAFPVTIITRYKLLIDATDMTAQIRVILFDKEAQEMLYQRVETSLELLKTHDGRATLKQQGNIAVGSFYTFTFKMSNKSIQFINRSGYTAQTIEWIPQKCLTPTHSSSVSSANVGPISEHSAKVNYT